jgi:Uri superfamily endonuclease
LQIGLTALNYKPNCEDSNPGVRLGIGIRLRRGHGGQVGFGIGIESTPLPNRTAYMKSAVPFHPASFRLLPFKNSAFTLLPSYIIRRRMLRIPPDERFDGPGAYELEISLRQPVDIQVGQLGRFRFPRGRYIYVGSANGGLRGRVERHLRFAAEKPAKTHWHVDALLRLPEARIADIRLHPGADECDIASKIAQRPAATVPAPNFGATDCQNKCPAHLFRV